MINSENRRMQSVPTLEYWFDFGSTYSYLTSMRIESVCSRRGIQVTWRPFLLGPTFQEQGWSTSPFNLFPAEGRYMWKEMERHAKKYGLSAYRKPSVFPRNGLLCARVAIAAESEAWVGAFVRTVFQANFERDLDISSKEIVASILRGMGLNAGEWLAQAELPETKTELREQTEHARQLDIFGAPSFIASGELFWGDDRLEEACDLL